MSHTVDRLSAKALKRTENGTGLFFAVLTLRKTLHASIFIVLICTQKWSFFFFFFFSFGLVKVSLKYDCIILMNCKNGHRIRIYTIIIICASARIQCRTAHVSRQCGKLHDIHCHGSAQISGLNILRLNINNKCMLCVNDEM